jgi:hypothetical protein
MSFISPDDCPPQPPAAAGLHAAILHEACETVGGIHRLAHLLDVPVDTLVRWVEGGVEPPEAIYRACVDIVLLHPER